MTQSVAVSRSVVGLLSGAVTTCLVLGMLGAPAAADEEPAARASAPALTVATFNVLSGRSGVAWKPRRARVLKMIKQTKADVIVLQEADAAGPWRSIPVEKARAKRLPTLWLARKAGLRWAPPTGYISNDSSSGMYVRSRGPQILYNPNRLTQVATPCQQNGRLDLNYVTLADRKSGRLLRVTGVHFNRGTTAGHQAGRLRVLERADGWMQKCRNLRRFEAAPMIYAGDFNTTDQAMVQALHARGVVDSVKIAGRRTHHRINTYKGRGSNVTRKGVRIDQIWVPRGSRVDSWTQLVNIKKNKYVGPLVSDHNPVVARVVLPG